MLLVVSLLSSFLLSLGVAYVFRNVYRDDTNESHWIEPNTAPRRGGVIVLATVLASLCLIASSNNKLGLMIIISSLPLVLSGICEDYEIRITPKNRLLASAISSILALVVLNVWLNRVDIPVLDRAMSLPAIGIAATLMFSAGLSHSFNLADGLNGLCSGLGIIASGFISYIAYIHVEYELALFSVIFGSSLLGFWLVNFFTGRVYLGDAGAYLIGHTIAWCCIILAVRQPQISAWSLLLAIIYPVSETMITVLRRLKARKNVFLPDQLHIHHLLWKKLSSRSFSHRLSNSIASAIILSGAFATTLFAVRFYQSTAHCFSLAACLFFFACLLYRSRATDGAG